MRGHHRLPLFARGRGADGRCTRHLRLRRQRTPDGTDCPASGNARARADSRITQPGTGSSPRRRLGRRGRRRAARSRLTARSFSPRRATSFRSHCELSTRAPRLQWPGSGCPTSRRSTTQAELFRERRLRSVTANTRRDGEEFLRLAQRFGVRATTVAYDMADAPRALADLAHGRFGGAAVLHNEPSP